MATVFLIGCFSIVAQPRNILTGAYTLQTVSSGIVLGKAFRLAR